MSRLLNSDEREVICGDFAESGTTAGDALRDVLGLVIRRQVALWMDSGPWLALAGVAVPLALLLSQICRSWADGSAVYAWLYVNNWTWSFVEIPGARRDLLDTAVRFLLNSITLIGWSWTAGLALGFLSRRTIWVNGSLFCLVAVGSSLGYETVASRNISNAAVFSQGFYGVVWPVILHTAFVMLPALGGMRRVHRRRQMPLLGVFLSGVAMTVLTAHSIQNVGASVVLGWGPFLPFASAPRVALAVVVLWPVGYMVATTALRHAVQQNGPRVPEGWPP